ncbi:G-protein coupled receptors family 1 profile domain-containing protein [Caenorhabditis elegans]|uniref:G-protein coupled receptors family 1 profile domain-containing protein n=1 Tax=Caenorhabditis elegans TaxID=6239 RepID=Q9GUH0_CAEEL|nr:G-protein coupled receptors family 1 profile domain-containing protein [Caenorhabditis elegans]CCD74161.1 G-protein coupled receptors family 1 profile domain-containing protein [Caenorhabditis elegans]|eukprot:NP_872112.1 Serpentine Receptor, class V [Caenorhabditis elegans]
MNNSVPLLPPSWPITVYYITSAITLPIYFLVFTCLFRLRCISKTYNTTFYTLLLQHCIADLLAMMMYFVIIAARAIPIIREFYFNYQDYYIAAAAYNHIYYTLYIRCSGIVFLSFQRYQVITHPHSPLTNKIQTLSKFKLISIYWLVPTIISLVVLKDINFHYDNIVVMTVVAEKSVIQRNTLMALIVVGLTCALCSISYGALFLFIRKHSNRISKSLSREIHLAVQVFILLLAFFAILVYYSFQNYFSQTQNTGPIYYMRGMYPMANGFLSYINPFCILILNRDLTKQVIRSVSCQRFAVSEVQLSGNVSVSTRQQRRHLAGNQVTF